MDKEIDQARNCLEKAVKLANTDQKRAIQAIIAKLDEEKFLMGFSTPLPPPATIENSPKQASPDQKDQDIHIKLDKILEKLEHSGSKITPTTLTPTQKSALPQTWAQKAQLAPKDQNWSLVTKKPSKKTLIEAQNDPNQGFLNRRVLVTLKTDVTTLNSMEIRDKINQTLQKAGKPV